MEFPKSQTDAAQAGSTRYFTGKPCKHGHIDLRMTESGACLECKRILSSKRRNLIAAQLKGI